MKTRTLCPDIIEVDGEEYVPVEVDKPVLAPGMFNCSVDVIVLLESGNTVIGYYHHGAGIWYDYNANPIKHVRGWQTI